MPEWLSLLEVAGRTALVYFVVLVLLRMIGRRQIGQSTPSDLVTLLLISEAVQNGMLGEDSSLAGSIVSVATLLSLSYLMEYLSARHPAFERRVEGVPQVVYREGRFSEREMRSMNISERDLLAAIRARGYDSLNAIRMIVLEPDGRVSILEKIPEKRLYPGQG